MQRPQPGRVETDRRRAELIREVCRSALEPGHWEQLEPREQAALLARWQPDLEAWNTRFLQQLASSRVGTPCVLVDDELNLYYSRKNKRRASRLATSRPRDPLQEFVKEANRLGALVLGTDLDGTPVTMAMDNLDTHLAILGTTGVGKTVLASNLFVQLATRGGPMLLLDPHDDFIQSAIPNLPPDRLRDVVYIDPSDLEATWGINVLQMARDLVDESDPNYNALMQRMIDQSVSYIVDALSVLQEDTTGYQAGPSIRSLMRAGFMAASEREDTSLVDVYSLLTKTDVQDLVVPTLLRHHVRDYFQDTVRDLNREYLERVRNKLEVFLDSILVNTMCRRDECIGIPEMLRQNKIIVVDLNRDRLSPTVSSLIGYLILIITMFAIDRRELLPKQEQTPFYAFVAEFSNFASRIVSRWVSEARKKNAGIIMDFQHLAQLPEEVQEALGNVGTLAAFRPTDQDAPLLCKRLGLTTETGQPLVHEMLDLPQHVMRLQFDEEDGHATRPSTQRSMVTVRGLQPLPLPTNHADVLERAKRRSRKLFGKRNQISDQRTTYSADVVGSQAVLEAVWSANLAVQHPESFLLETTNEKARWALENGVSTQSLIQAILAAQGYRLALGHFRQILHSLRVQELIRVRKTPNGYLHTEATRQGILQIRGHVVPGRSRNEGGDTHKLLLLRLYKALRAWTPLPLQVPPQLIDKYTPDLVLDRLGDKVPASLSNVLAQSDSIHFHVENQTRKVPMRIANNLGQARTAGADPVMVIHAQNRENALRSAVQHHDLVQKKILGREWMRTAKQEINHQGSLSTPYRLWVVTPQLELLEYDAKSRRVTPVQHLYKAPRPAPEANPRTAKSTPSSTRQPRSKTEGKPPIARNKTAAPKKRMPESRTPEQPGRQSPSSDSNTDRTAAVFKQVVGNLILAPTGQRLLQSTLIDALSRHPPTCDLTPEHVDEWMRSLFFYERIEREGQTWYVST